MTDHQGELVTDHAITSHADIAGVVIDLAKVPSHSSERATPAGSHVRSTGQGYTLDDGTVVARADIASGPRPESADE